MRITPTELREKILAADKSGEVLIAIIGGIRFNLGIDQEGNVHVYDLLFTADVDGKEEWEFYSTLTVAAIDHLTVTSDAAESAVAEQQALEANDRWDREV